MNLMAIAQSAIYVNKIHKRDQHTRPTKRNRIRIDLCLPVAIIASLLRQLPTPVPPIPNILEAGPINIQRLAPNTCMR